MIELSPGSDLEVEGLQAPLERADGSNGAHQTHEQSQRRVADGAPIDSTQSLEEIERAHIVEVLQPNQLEDRRHRWRCAPSQAASQHSAQPDLETRHPAQRQPHFVNPTKYHRSRSRGGP